jgi:hypothetical protein
MVILFGAAWVLTIGFQWFWKVSLNLWPIALLGLGLVYCMSRVYLLRAVPPWNSWRTPMTFFLSLTILGTLGINLALPSPGWSITAGLAMTAELCLILIGRPTVLGSTGRFRFGLLGIVIVLILLSAGYSQVVRPWQASAFFLLALVAEVIGRWQFFAGRTPFLMDNN